jgi:hypothetical protein
MFVHSVYFWLNDGLTEDQRREFRHAAELLLAIDTVECGFVGAPADEFGFAGPPADTDRPVIDSTYSVALTVVFQDMIGHDAYQTAPAHLAFVDRYGTWWKKVLIYDAD